MTKGLHMNWKRVRQAALLTLGLLAATGTAFAQGTLSNLVVAGLTPPFDPAIKAYKVPTPSNCTVTITATLANPLHTMYVANSQTASGATRQAWVCNGTTKADIVLYNGWTEVGRYTVTPDANLAPPPPPPPPAGMGKLSALAIYGLSPAFDPNVTTYSLQRTTCAVPVTATLAYAGNILYVQDGLTTSGAARQAWVCDGKTKISVVLYNGWTEVGRYTVNMVGTAPPAGTPTPSTPPPPPPPPAEAAPTPTPVPAVSSGPLPAQQPVDATRALAFLGQATFGPTAGDLATVQTDGLDRWLEQQFRMPRTTLPAGLDLSALRSQVFTNMTTAPDQLRQRVSFALGQVLVVSANKNIYGPEIQPFYDMLSTYAFTNYRTLLRETTLSPSMGKYLDMANSQKSNGTSSPNENFPREVLQLFSIGLWELNQDGSQKKDAQDLPIPTYTQASIQAVAKALSGWTYPTKPNGAANVLNQEYFAGLMEPRPAYHDLTAKTIPGGTVLPAGQSTTADLEGFIDAIFNHPNVPPFVATRLIRSLVTSNPSPAYIARVADAFVDNGSGVRGDMQAVVRAILTDEEAAVTGATDGHLKDPILHVVGLARALGAQVTDPSMFMYLFDTLGQMVLTPNTVFNFYSPLAALPNHKGYFGPEFQIYAPAMTILRGNLIWGILTGQLGSAFQVNLTPFTALANNPPALVEKVNQTLFFGRMSTELRGALVSATQAVAGYNTQQRALGALYLAALSSEYAVFTGGPVQ